MTVDRDRRKKNYQTERRVAVRVISALVQLSRAVSKHWHDHNNNNNYNGRVPSAKADDRTLTGRALHESVEWVATIGGGRLHGVSRGARSPQRWCCCLRTAAVAHDVDHVVPDGENCNECACVRVRVRVRVYQSVCRTDLTERASVVYWRRLRQSTATIIPSSPSASSRRRRREDMFSRH